jgi:GT2 family glycosyltransferase
MMETLSILIPVFNALEYTNKAIINLKSEIANSSWILNQSIYIIVIDDNSSDGTSDFIRQNHPDIVLCQGDGNLWWSGGINTGAQHAFNVLKCSYVLLWNNDIITEKNYFQNLYKIIQNEKSIQIFGSKIIILNSNHIWSMGGTFNAKTGKKTMIGFGKPDGEPYQNVIECDWITGMGTVVHRSVVEKIGYWDQINFPQYHGDSDFTFKAKKAGFNLKIFPNLIIFNDISHTGILHNLTFKSLIKSLTSLRSDFNINKDYLFYKIHSTSPIAYQALFVKYFKYIGGFLKHKYFKR